MDDIFYIMGKHCFFFNFKEILLLGMNFLKVYVFLFFLTGVTNITLGQKKMTLFFNDGTEQTGYVTFKKKEAVFQEKAKGKKIKFKYALLDSASTPRNKRAKRQREPKTVYFLSEGNKEKSRGVYDLVSRGKINLYKKTSYAGYSGIWMANAGGPGTPIFMPTGGGKSKVIIYAIQKDEAGNLEVLGTKFNKQITNYFPDCSALTEKVEAKEKGFRKKDIKNIINFYNQNCSD